MEHGAKMTAPIKVCTNDKQHAIVRHLLSEGMKGGRDPSIIIDGSLPLSILNILGNQL
jgi:hypothetical protein